MMRIRLRKRTTVFIGFMSVFVLLLLFLTYYSQVAYYKSLPRVVTMMPERTEYYKNGRYLYIISERAVQKDPDTGKMFIYTARHYRDILGERYIITEIVIRIEEKMEGERVLIDGIVMEEPVVTERAEQFYNGQPVLVEEAQ